MENKNIEIRRIYGQKVVKTESNNDKELKDEKIITIVIKLLPKKSITHEIKPNNVIKTNVGWANEKQNEHNNNIIYK